MTDTNASNSSYDEAYAQPTPIQQHGSAPSALGQSVPVALSASPYPPAAVKRSSGKGWIVALIAVILLFIAIMTGIFSCSSQVNAIASSSGLTSESTQMHATTDSIAIIELSGTIQYDGTSCSPEGLKSLLDQAEEDPRIKGVVLRVNSGGGVATAGEEMTGYVREFSKPIVVSSASTNASAAYEISSQADLIFTEKTSMLGSIGVAMQVTDLSGLYDMLGIKVTDIVSSESKDSTYGNRALTEEERAWYQHMVDQICEEFINTVADGRDMTYEEVKELANGLPFTGIDAVENRLADRIGGLEEAVEAASKMAGYSTSLSTIDLTASPSSMMDLLDILGAQAKQASSESSAIAKAQ